MTEPFDFKQCTTMLKSTGKRASNLRELRECITVIDEESMFHHTFQYFLKGHLLEYTNDFAHWAGESLEERALSERLSSIDPYEFDTMESLRKSILTVIDDYLKKFPEPRQAMAGDEFYFNQTLTLIFSSGIRARNLAECLMGIKYVDPTSIYYHFFEARMRLGADDFSTWIAGPLERKSLAEKIRAIDPFMHSLEEIRQHLYDTIETELKTEMKTPGGEL
ncbi:MAG TPA: DUF5752 family protein [Dissulfurispiraceae bacterium]|nr:DUF5752 family protein [Dissulfurispiraceae bacterium]